MNQSMAMKGSVMLTLVLLSKTNMVLVVTRLEQQFPDSLYVMPLRMISNSSFAVPHLRSATLPKLFYSITRKDGKRKYVGQYHVVCAPAAPLASYLAAYQYSGQAPGD